MLPITAAVDRFAPPQQNRPMNCKSFMRIATLLAIAFIPLVHAEDSGGPQRRLYVAVPGIRNYLQYGGHGVLVFDINNGHRFLRRIPAGGIGKDGKPMNGDAVQILSIQQVGNLETKKFIHVHVAELVPAVDSERPHEIAERPGGAPRIAPGALLST